MTVVSKIFASEPRWSGQEKINVPRILKVFFKHLKGDVLSKMTLRNESGLLDPKQSQKQSRAILTLSGKEHFAMQVWPGGK